VVKSRPAKHGGAHGSVKQVKDEFDGRENNPEDVGEQPEDAAKEPADALEQPAEDCNR